MTEEEAETWQDRLRARMRERGVTAAEVSRNTPISEGSISQWLAGNTREPKYESLRAVARYLHTSVDWILYADGSTLGNAPSATHKAQQFSAITVTYTIEVSTDGTWLPDDEQEWRIRATVPGPGGSDAVFAAEIRGDAYAPTLRDGWFLTFNPEGPLVPSEFVRIEFADGRRMIAELLWERGDSIGLMQVNTPDRLTVRRHEIASIMPVTGIVPPSMLSTA